MAYMMEIIFITRNNTGADKLGQSFTPKMSETMMPKRGGCGDERGGAGGGWLERIEVARAIAPGDHVPGLQILHRKAKRIKFNRTIVIGGKTANGNQILNDVGRHQNIVKNKIEIRKGKRV
jgi:hypothetical protein